ncbi:AAA family ATPase [Nesterenkonia sp. MY13]|uniref:AAA family ATPase n=1 Tax=Nesterenkonia sedimenti TaxID=1463632 RepID=A0A7X8TJU3_9MICC|nr:AAA family ATPase [Nesterenkonia sedimenti]
MTVLHGARSVGKTSLVRRLKEQGVLATAVSLTDPDVLHLAKQDTSGWLRALPQPFAIDEAQLLPDLPLALKNYLNETGDDVQAILTGSAQIGRSSLGGSDPLAGRTTTLTLQPLTEPEVHSSAQTAWSVADMMFQSPPQIGHRANDAFWWHKAVLYGGLPRTRLRKPSRATLRDQLSATIEAILSDHVLPDERFDADNARRILDYILRHPAGELKVQVIGREVGLDPRTVDRYIDVLERRFLVTELHNLRPPAKKTPRTMAKDQEWMCDGSRPGSGG